MKVIMNPPYCGSLHLKILQATLQYCNDIVCVHPLYYAVLNDRVKDFHLKMELAAHLKNEPTVITVEEADALFGIDSYTQLIIGCYGQRPLYTVKMTPEYGLWKKLVATGTPLGKLYSMEKGQYAVPVAKLFLCGPLITQHGPVAKSGWTKGLGDKWAWVNFDTAEEAENFRDLFCDTFIGKLLLHFRPGRQIAHFTLPTDYKRKWTDERLYEYYKLTLDEMHTVQEMTQNEKKVEKSCKK